MKKNYLLFCLFILGSYALLLSLAALLAPYFQSKSVIDISSVLYSFLFRHCHQIPERSLWIFGLPMGLCSRCFSFYTTFALTTFLLAFVRNQTRHWKLGFFLMVPLLLDGLTQLSELRTSTNSLRIITGLLAGIGLPLVLRKIVWILSEWLPSPFCNRINLPKEYICVSSLVFIILFSSILLNFSPWVYSETERNLTLKQYTLVILVVRETLSSKDKKPGDNVQLAVAEDVIVDGGILIESGTPVMGKASVAREPGSLGEPGEIAIVPQYVEAVDGQNVRLGGTLYVRGRSKEESTAVLTAICLPFALRSGGDVVVTDGTELKAYVERDYEIKVGD